jgi:hypothetical protein
MSSPFPFHQDANKFSPLHAVYNSGQSYTASRPFFEEKKLESAIYKIFDPYSWDAMMRLFK